jgi:hypothetical protein
MNLFPQFDAQTVQMRVEQYWDLSDKVPIPKFQPTCAVCGSDEILLKSWSFHQRKTGSHNPYRCDVRFKCTVCSYVWFHGVAVPREMYLNNQPNLVVHYKDYLREAKR